MNTSIIALSSTIYLTSLTNVKEIFMIWLCGLYFAFSGPAILFSTNCARCFGKRDFGFLFWKPIWLKNANLQKRSEKFHDNLCVDFLDGREYLRCCLKKEIISFAKLYKNTQKVPFTFLTILLGPLSEVLGWFWFFIMGCGFSIIGDSIFWIEFYFLS